MKDKEKQIEEMAKDLEPFITLHREVYVSANRKERHAWMLSEEDNKVIAESLVAKDYRKLLEDSVVLSREEIEDKIKQVKELEKNYYEKVVIPQSSKETAEKILNYAETYLFEDDTDKLYFKEFLKKDLGIEIKE